MDKENIFSVSEVNQHIRNVVESSIPTLYVEGEISNYTHHRSGHIYFSIKDSASTLRCVFFRGNNIHLKFTPKEGDQVICVGNITIYERGGNYQLNVRKMLPSGIGDLQRKFEELKDKLHKEGLFDEIHKKPIPQYPEVIGVVTSATGAAIQDIRNVINRRYPCKILLYPATVQGENAAQEIIEGINYFRKNPVDILIIGRGGGSQEDLFCFNDEDLARTIFACEIPIISAVGHEIDFTISDFVADLRAPTPSAAAELAVPDKTDLQSKINAYSQQMQRIVQQYIFQKKLYLQDLESRLHKQHPQQKIMIMHNSLDNLTKRMQLATERIIEARRQKLALLQNQLKELSPNEILKRGYSFILLEKKLMKSVKNLEIGNKVEILFADGKCQAEILDIEDEN